MTSIILNGSKSGELSTEMAWHFAKQVVSGGSIITMWTDKVLCVTSREK